MLIGGDAKLEDLGQEMQSLKRLLENRVGKAGTPTPTGRSYPSSTANGQQISVDKLSASNGKTTPNLESATGSSAPAPGVTVPKRERAIPAWQKAAAGKSGTASPSANEEGSTMESGA